MSTSSYRRSASCQADKQYWQACTNLGPGCVRRAPTPAYTEIALRSLPGKPYPGIDSYSNPPSVMSLQSPGSRVCVRKARIGMN